MKLKCMQEKKTDMSIKCRVWDYFKLDNTCAHDNMKVGL